MSPEVNALFGPKFAKIEHNIQVFNETKMCLYLLTLNAVVAWRYSTWIPLGCVCSFLLVLF